MNLGKPLITIITPTYNAAKTIEKCLASIASQSMSNYELIVVDGMSTDHTVELVQQARTKFSNVKVHVEKDRGVFDAMNKGIQLSTSDWLYFLGADDYLYDGEVLKDVAIFLQSTNADIVYGNVYFESLGRVYDGAFDIEKILKINVCHQSIFYRASVFKTIGSYNLRYKKVSDYDFNLKCWLGGNTRQQFIERTVAYYSHGGISSAGDDKLFFEDYPDVIVDAVLYGNLNGFLKIHVLSKAYRKILQRYPFQAFLSRVNNSKFFLVRLCAAIWLGITFPFYLVKKQIPERTPAN